MKKLHNTKSIILILTIVFFACLIVFSSCANSNINNSNTKSIKDAYNREVYLPNEINRIATVGCAARYCVYSKAIDKLVAVTDIDKKKDITKPYTFLCADKFKDLPSTSNGNHINATNIDKEKLLATNPDVILSSRSEEECNQLQAELNIPVVGIYAQDDIWYYATANIGLVGSLTNTMEEAQNTIDYLNSMYLYIESISEYNNLKIYRGALNYKGAKNLCGTISNFSIYNLMKLNNVAQNNQIKSEYDCSLEQILEWNPDYIFMDCTNKQLVENQKNQNADIFNQINAFKNNHAYYLAPFNSNGTNIEYAYCEMFYTAMTLYPDKFQNTEFENIAHEIFLKVLGEDIYDELTSQGICFEEAKL